jgi:hypothetical protein
MTRTDAIQKGDEINDHEVSQMRITGLAVGEGLFLLGRQNGAGGSGEMHPLRNNILTPGSTLRYS